MLFSKILSPCSLGLVWLISRTFSANEYYFSLTPNQSTVLSVMTYQPSEQGTHAVQSIRSTFRSSHDQRAVGQGKVLQVVIIYEGFFCFVDPKLTKREPLRP